METHAWEEKNSPGYMYRLCIVGDENRIDLPREVDPIFFGVVLFLAVDESFSEEVDVLFAVAASIDMT